mgnify:FL=1
MTTKTIGDLGEYEAVRFLKKKRIKPIVRNYRSGRNEIDIIAGNKEYIIFAEVKTRALTPGNERFGSAASAVDREKRRRLIAAAKDYLRENCEIRQPRFDVIEVYLDGSDGKYRVAEINHIENAFGKNSV